MSTEWEKLRELASPTPYLDGFVELVNTTANDGIWTDREVGNRMVDELKALTSERDGLKKSVDFWMSMFHQEEESWCSCNIVDDPELYYVCERHAASGDRAKAHQETIRIVQKAEKVETELDTLKREREQLRNALQEDRERDMYEAYHAGWVARKSRHKLATFSGFVTLILPKLKLAGETPTREPSDCHDCGRPYSKTSLDAVICEQDWNVICPEGGILCASCIIERAATRLPNATVARMQIEQSKFGELVAPQAQQEKE